MNTFKLSMGAVALLLTSNAWPEFTKVAGIGDSRIQRIAISKSNPSFLSVASINNLYISEDGGDSFRETVVLKDEQATHLFIDQDSPSTVILSATRNCYKINQGVEKIFTADEAETIHFIFKHKESIYVGTSRGLYLATMSLLQWKMVPGFSGKAVYSADGLGDRFLLACDSGVYMYYPNGSFIRLFVARNHGDDGGLRLNQVKADRFVPERFWLCTDKGVFRSNDQGVTWEKFYIAGAANVSSYCLAQTQEDENQIYLCSDVGFFSVDTSTGESQPLFEGLTTSEVNWMDSTAAGDIYLATDDGLFTSIDSNHPASAHMSLDEMIAGEPSIHEVQEAALHYNSVHPDKVAHWRKKLKYRALFPKLSVDYDQNIVGSSSSGHFYTGPNEWGVSLSWDIGNLIWDSYEDDVDNRNKLTTQLRLDILDEINRLYFERLRLKMEIKSAGSKEDTSARQLRLSELTAALDGYTGGSFSCD